MPPLRLRGILLTLCLTPPVSKPVYRFDKKKYIERLILEIIAIFLCLFQCLFSALLVKLQLCENE